MMGIGVFGGVMSMKVIKAIFTGMLVAGLMFAIFFESGCMPQARDTQPDEKTPMTIDTLPSPEPQKSAIRDTIQWGWVKVDVANVRSQPNTKSSIVTKVKKGAVIALKENKDGWWSVIITDSLSGYIKAELITTDVIELLNPVATFLLAISNSESNDSPNLIANAETGGVDEALRVYVTDIWYLLSTGEQKLACLHLFDLWKSVLQKHGDNPWYAQLSVYDTHGTEVAEIDTGFWGDNVEVILK
jgi:hypothetical protein